MLCHVNLHLTKLPSTKTPPTMHIPSDSFSGSFSTRAATTPQTLSSNSWRWFFWERKTTTPPKRVPEWILLTVNCTSASAKSFRSSETTYSTSAGPGCSSSVELVVRVSIFISAWTSNFTAAVPCDHKQRRRRQITPKTTMSDSSRPPCSSAPPKHFCSFTAAPENKNFIAHSHTFLSSPPLPSSSLSPHWTTIQVCERGGLRDVTLAISAPIFLHRRIHEEGSTTTITKSYDQQKTLLSLQKKSTRAMRTRPDFRSCLSATIRGDKDERQRERGDVDIWELRKTLDRLFGAQFLRRKES